MCYIIYVTHIEYNKYMFEDIQAVRKKRNM